MREPPLSQWKNRNPRNGAGNGKSTAGGSQQRQYAAQPDKRSGLFRGFGMPPNKQKQRFPASPGTAVSSLCGNKDTACKVANYRQRFILNSRFQSPRDPKVRCLASRAFVYTNAQNGLPASLPKVRFCLLGLRPKPFEQPGAGAGCAFGNQMLMVLQFGNTQSLPFIYSSLMSGLSLYPML